MNVAGSLFAISQISSMNKPVDDLIKLETGETVTVKELIDYWIEGHKVAKEISKIVEKNKGESIKVGVQKDKNLERVPKKVDRGERAEMSKLRKENEDTSVPSRRRKRGELPKSKS